MCLGQVPGNGNAVVRQRVRPIDSFKPFLEQHISKFWCLWKNTHQSM